MSREERSISQRLSRAGSIETKREALLEWLDEFEQGQKHHCGLAARTVIQGGKDENGHDPVHHLIAAAYRRERKFKALRKIIKRITDMT